MTDSNQSQDQTSEIGGRYLRRTVGEIGRLRELMASARDGSTASLDEILRIAHRMQGTGAMFGFDTISEAAGRLERAVEVRLTAGSEAELALFRQCDDIIDSLALATHVALRWRGIL